MIIILAIGTVLLLGWCVLLIKASDKYDDEILVQEGRAIQATKQKLKKYIELKRNNLPLDAGIVRKIDFKMNSEKGYTEEYLKLIKKGESLEEGEIGIVSTLALPGYELIDICKLRADNKLFKNLVKSIRALEGKDNAMDKARYVLATMFSYLVLSIGVAVIMLAWAIRMLSVEQAIIIFLCFIILGFLLGYIPYDNILERAKKREKSILRDFPQVVSKLALLVGAGMETTQAWADTAYSGTTPLYIEMKKVVEEIENNISPEFAYTGFSKRCEMKQTTKLATNIIQSLNKGNDEIGDVLNNLSTEAWEERKHLARREGEEAQTKLAIPMLLMFLGILIFIMAPMMMNMGSM